MTVRMLQRSLARRWGRVYLASLERQGGFRENDILGEWMCGRERVLRRQWCGRGDAGRTPGLIPPGGYGPGSEVTVLTANIGDGMRHVGDVTRHMGDRGDDGRRIRTDGES